MAEPPGILHQEALVRLYFLQLVLCGLQEAVRGLAHLLFQREQERHLLEARQALSRRPDGGRQGLAHKRKREMLRRQGHPFQIGEDDKEIACKLPLDVMGEERLAHFPAAEQRAALALPESVLYRKEKRHSSGLRCRFFRRHVFSIPNGIYT